MPDFAIA